MTVRHLNFLARRTLAYWRQHGTSETVRAVSRKLKGRRPGHPLVAPAAPGVGSPAPSPGREQHHTPQALFEARFANLRPIRTYVLPADGRRRITMVTDSISKGSLFGGVGTALIFAAELANAMDATLRIVTRTEPAPPENVQHVLAVYGMRLRNEIAFDFAWIEDSRHELALQPDELVITTSWWTTAAALAGVPARQIVYLLQEDERMFYPFGDERFLCERTLRRSDIRFVINTDLLFRHLVESGLSNVAHRGISFEPAFPDNVFHPRQVAGRTKRRFFFYARPVNARNLFHLGLEVIRNAVDAGVLDPQEWEICFVGKHIPEVDLGEGVQVRRIEDLEWAAYASFIGGVDLALSLMYTPHPSYPPLDVAASGGVVVTNRHGLKQDLSGYSRNIICADCDVEPLVQGLREGVALARSPQRQLNFGQNGLNRSWQEAFQPIVQQLAHQPLQADGLLR